MENVLPHIALSLQDIGGKSLMVGGFIRDNFLDLPSKDIDIEVYNVTADQLVTVLENFGKVSTVGASFGVIKLTTPEGDDFDFSLPRKDSKVSEGHTGFTVEVDHNLTVEEAASRRDFTINAISQDILTGEVSDPFNGINDLREGILRATSSQFAEDPLRVLRGFQFAGRFNMVADQPTADMCRSLIPEYGSLATERVWTEFHKWATKSVVPSRGLEFLRETGWLDVFPEIKDMMYVPQNPKWHPEGDVYQHTLCVVNEAARIAIRENLDEDSRLILVLSALCHDFGKPSTTKLLDASWKSQGHPEAGVDVTRSFLESIGCPEAIIKVIEPLVGAHLFHTSGDFTKRAVRRLALRLGDATIDQLLLLIEADMGGRPPLKGGLPPAAVRLQLMAMTLDVQSGGPTPLMGGRHLITLGLKPGVEFGVILDQAFQAQLDGDFDNDVDGFEFLKTLI